MIPEKRRYDYCLKYCDRLYRNRVKIRQKYGDDRNDRNDKVVATSTSPSERALIPFTARHPEKEIYPSRIALTDFSVIGRSVPAVLNRSESKMVWAINKKIFSKNVIRTLPSPTGVRNSVEYTKTALIKETKPISWTTGMRDSGTVPIPVRGALTASTSTRTVPSNRLFSDQYWTQLTAHLSERLKRVENRMDIIIPGLKRQVIKLQSKCVQCEQDIATLKSLATIQQKSLNRICQLFGMIGVAMTPDNKSKSPQLSSSHKSDESASSQHNHRSVKFNLNRSKKREKQKTKSKNGSKVGGRPRW